MSKPLSQLIQERIETFQETARIHSKYETECRICQTTLNELETIQTALNEVIKEIESERSILLSALKQKRPDKNWLEGREHSLFVCLTKLK